MGVVMTVVVFATGSATLAQQFGAVIEVVTNPVLGCLCVRLHGDLALPRADSASPIGEAISRGSGRGDIFRLFVIVTSKERCRALRRTEFLMVSLD